MNGEDVLVLVFSSSSSLKTLRVSTTLDGSVVVVEGGESSEEALRSGDRLGIPVAWILDDRKPPLTGLSVKATLVSGVYLEANLGEESRPPLVVGGGSVDRLRIWVGPRKVAAVHGDHLWVSIGDLLNALGWA